MYLSFFGICDLRNELGQICIVSVHGHDMCIDVEMFVTDSSLVVFVANACTALLLQISVSDGGPVWIE